MKNLETKIFVTSVLLLELLDETQGDTRFKHRLRYHLNGIEKEIEKLISLNINNTTSLLISKATQSLEDSIDITLSSTIEPPKPTTEYNVDNADSEDDACDMLYGVDNNQYP